MEKLLIELITEFKGFKSEMHQRMDGIDKRFDEVDKKFDVVDKRFEQMDIRFFAMDKKLFSMDEKFTGKFTEVTKRLNRIETKLDSTKEVVVNIKEDQFIAFSEMKEMNKNIKVLLQNSSNHEQQLFRLAIKTNDTEH